MKKIRNILATFFAIVAGNCIITAVFSTDLWLQIQNITFGVLIFAVGCYVVATLSKTK